MATKTGTLRFKTGKGFAELMMGLTRQAYWMENRQEWALDTLACLRGITVEQAKAVLAGIARLEDGEEENTTVLVEEKDTVWMKELAKHQAWIETRTYLFGTRRVSVDLVDFYTDNIVRRLRHTMMMGFVPNPVETMGLEQQRRDTHNEIFQEAGFSRRDIEVERDGYTGNRPDFEAFDRALQKHLNLKTGWMIGINTE